MKFLPTNSRSFLPVSYTHLSFFCLQVVIQSDNNMGSVSSMRSIWITTLLWSITQSVPAAASARRSARPMLLSDWITTCRKKKDPRKAEMLSGGSFLCNRRLQGISYYTKGTNVRMIHTRAKMQIVASDRARHENTPRCILYYFH